MKFICDYMLIRLGKWLRAAGYDTEIITKPISDRDVLAIALAQQRFLITRDRHFLHMKAAQPILIYLKSNDFSSCLQELNQKCIINWLYALFTRCLNCNSLLEKSSPSQLTNISTRIREEKKEFFYCPSCQHIYWEGSHTARMYRQLLAWQKISFAS